MTDASVARALRSSARLVVVEAPGGCGKTFQGAEYASEAAPTLGSGRVLVLAHTHAACDVFAKRAVRKRNLEIRTVDSLITEISAVYHLGLGLPGDPGAWARRTGNYDVLASKASSLLKSAPMVARAVAQRYPVIVCDEHQDCTADQHEIVGCLHKAGAALRVFGDPMQSIYFDSSELTRHQDRWKKLCEDADAFEVLDTPHRWERLGSSELGQWILEARDALKSAGRIDLRRVRPQGLSVVYADNQATGFGQYRLATVDRKPLDKLVANVSPLLILSSRNAMTRGLRAFFTRRIPLWEGHTRDALNGLVGSVADSNGNADLLAKAILRFLKDVGIGLSATAFGDAFENEVRTQCAIARKKKPAKIQALARLLIQNPSHIGVAEVLRQLDQLVRNDPDFVDAKIDCRREYLEAMRLGQFENCEAGLAEINRRRTFARPFPPPQAISSIHKAKGLECDHVAVIPCDAQHFDNSFKSRCLLYVAISRPMRTLTLVIPKNNASPLFLL